MKAMISAIQTEKMYGEYETPKYINGYSSQKNLHRKSCFANAKVFSNITAEDLPPIRDRHISKE